MAFLRENAPGAAAVATLRAAIFDRRFIDGVFVYSCFYIFFVKN
jgi:hypothetical protein